MNTTSSIVFLADQCKPGDYIGEIFLFTIAFAIFTCLAFKKVASTKISTKPPTSTTADEQADDREERMSSFSHKIMILFCLGLYGFVKFVLTVGPNSIEGNHAHILNGKIRDAHNDLNAYIRAPHLEPFICVLIAFVMYANKFHLFLQKWVTVQFRDNIKQFTSGNDNGEMWSLRVNCVVEVVKFTVASVLLFRIILKLAEGQVVGRIFAVFFVFFHYETLHVWNPVTCLLCTNPKQVAFGVATLSAVISQELW